eukprot:TRINITY_DN37633_c0_g2_i1.p1 TRINITY_DN37633_c0_g2~~TRINITY_DN37633_c0_g2_i1.p1  ORF type:complete len:652 (-),score=131.27 TRINITY_DN37633_c0_g2_i1:185-2083(-)
MVSRASSTARRRAARERAVNWYPSAAAWSMDAPAAAPGRPPAWRARDAEAATHEHAAAAEAPVTSEAQGLQASDSDRPHMQPLQDGPSQRFVHSWVTGDIEPVDSTVTPAWVLAVRRNEAANASASEEASSPAPAAGWSHGPSRVPDTELTRCCRELAGLTQEVRSQSAAVERLAASLYPQIVDLRRQTSAELGALREEISQQAAALQRLDQLGGEVADVEAKLGAEVCLTGVLRAELKELSDELVMVRQSEKDAQCQLLQLETALKQEQAEAAQERAKSASLQSALLTSQEQVTSQGQHVQVSPHILFMGKADGQTDVHIVRIACPGVKDHEFEVAEEDVGTYTIRIDQSASPGVHRLTWKETLSLPSRQFEIVWENTRLEHGILELFFKERAQRRRVFRLSPTASRRPVTQEEFGGAGVPSSTEGDSGFEVVDATCSQRSRDGRNVKCFLQFTALPSPDGRLVLVQDLKLGDLVRTVDDSVASVVTLQKFESRRGKPHDVVELHTQQGAYRVSASHRVAMPPSSSAVEWKLAKELCEGDEVMIGEKARTLVKVALIQVRVPLFMLGFEPDLPVEMFPVQKWGMWTFGEPCSQSPASSQEMPYGHALLELVGIPACSEEDLLEAMPADYQE